MLALAQQKLRAWALLQEAQRRQPQWELKGMLPAVVLALLQKQPVQTLGRARKLRAWMAALQVPLQEALGQPQLEWEVPAVGLAMARAQAAERFSRQEEQGAREQRGAQQLE